MSSLSVTLRRRRVVLFVAPSLLVLVGGAQKPMRIASMVSFPVKFRLYLHFLVDVLAVVNVLEVEVLLDVYESGLYR